jgi:integrase
MAYCSRRIIFWQVDALELHVQLLQLIRLDFGGRNPFLHVWQHHDGVAVFGRHRIERDIVGEKTFSTKTSNESRTIQNRFITPPTNNRAISAQQQPTQYAPWRSPSRRQPGTSRRKPPRPSSALRLTHTCSGTPAAFSLPTRAPNTRTLQAYLGHRNIQHTARYTELSPTRFKNLWRD